MASVKKTGYPFADTGDDDNKCMHARTHVCTYVRMYVCTYVRMYVYMLQTRHLVAIKFFLQAYHCLLSIPTDINYYYFASKHNWCCC